MSIQQQQEDAVIRQRHDEWAAAWNKHDPKLMAAFWAADGDLINPFGLHARGTAELEKLFTEEHAGKMAGTTYAGTIESIRYLGESVAIVDVAGEISGMKGPDGAAAP
ncbi:MAG TPA: SgcJ/EcaC family oxidoreductase, partial [Verrucomicrobiae bacterium]|nr:SgcJ/EcaC family oxidoreductase [Verrucomicrobiae bacterium]